MKFEEMGVPKDMQEMGEVEMEINEDTWHTPFGEGMVQTRPKADGSYEMLLQIGNEEKLIDLGTTDPDKARSLHEQAVALADRQGPGMEKVAHSTLHFIAGKIEQDAKSEPSA